MDYDTVATFSQVTSLLMFIALFIGVLAYALWPANGKRFDRAQRDALDLDLDLNLNSNDRAKNGGR